MSQELLEMFDVGEVTVVRFSRPIQILGIQYDSDQDLRELRERLTWLVQEMGRRFILLNFEQVSFVTSWTLGPLIQIHRMVREAKGKFVLCGNPFLREIFAITSPLPGYRLGIIDTEENGLKYLSS